MNATLFIKLLQTGAAAHDPSHHVRPRHPIEYFTSLICQLARYVFDVGTVVYAFFTRLLRVAGPPDLLRDHAS